MTHPNMTLTGIVILGALSGCAMFEPTADNATVGSKPAATSAAAPAKTKPVVKTAKKWNPDGSFRKRANELDESVVSWTGQHGLVTNDGTAYAADVVPVMLYAARTGNTALYEAAYKGAQRLIMMEKSDPYTQGFVLTRRVANNGPEAAGATETLGMARALWEGADALGRPADRELALKVLEGYGKFAYEMNDQWLVRKQFDFATRSFAGSSMLSNYDADFFETVGRKAPRVGLNGFAKNSYALLTHSVSPSGLLYPLVQPEIGATYPGLPLEVYAPNGIVALEESCHGAIAAARGQPEVARGVLEFVRTRAGKPNDLYAYFGAEDGAHTTDGKLSDSGYACLATLALALGDAEEMSALEDGMIAAMKRATHDYGDKPGQLGAATTVLLAAQAAGAVQQRSATASAAP